MITFENAKPLFFQLKADFLSWTPLPWYFVNTQTTST